MENVRIVQEVVDEQKEKKNLNTTLKKILNEFLRRK